MADQRLTELSAWLSNRQADALSVLNGFFGDTLAQAGLSLAIPMAFFSNGQQLSLDRSLLRKQLPNPSGRICVLVHGVMAHPGMWRFAGDRDEDYGSLLAADRGVTPVYVRYNSGLHISSNAHQLDTQLGALLGAWPVRVEEVSLIAHSMGGLVCRGACHYATLAGRSWPASVRRVFLIGVPAKGAPLEMLAHLASFTLNTIPNRWTRLVGSVFKRRSAGIKDLRHGFMLDEDWQATDPDFLLSRAGTPVPLLGHAQYFVVAGNLWKNAEHPLARVLGDALVPEYSARGGRFLRRECGPFHESSTRIFPGVSHPALLNHPEVYEQIRHWWDTAV